MGWHLFGCLHAVASVAALCCLCCPQICLWYLSDQHGPEASPEHAMNTTNMVLLCC